MILKILVSIQTYPKKNDTSSKYNSLLEVRFFNFPQDSLHFIILYNLRLVGNEKGMEIGEIGDIPPSVA